MIINRGDWNLYYLDLIKDGRLDEVPRPNDYHVIDDVEIYDRVSEFRMEYREDILQWLDDLPSIVFVSGYQVKFKNHEDAMLFKLTWGGR